MTDPMRSLDELDPDERQALTAEIQHRLGLATARRLWVAANGPEVPIPDDLEPVFVEPGFDEEAGR